MKRSKFTVTHKETGERFSWYFWREPRVFQIGGNLERPHTGPLWMLEIHSGEVRGLEENWLDSVPTIRLVAENYGCTCPVD